MRSVLLLLLGAVAGLLLDRIARRLGRWVQRLRDESGTDRAEAWLAAHPDRHLCESEWGGWSCGARAVCVGEWGGGDWTLLCNQHCHHRPGDGRCYPLDSVRRRTWWQVVWDAWRAAALVLALLCAPALALAAPHSAGANGPSDRPEFVEEDCDPRCPASRDATIPPLRGPTPTTITTPKDPPPPGETTATAQLIAQHWSAQPLHPPGEAPPPTLLHDSLCALGLGAGLFLLFGGGDWLLRLWRRRRTRSGTAIHLWPLALLVLVLGGCTVPEGDWAGLVIFGLLCAATAAAQRP